MELNLNKTALENVACRKHVDTAKYSDVHACHLHVPDMAQRNFGEIKPSRPEGYSIIREARRGSHAAAAISMLMA